MNENKTLPNHQALVTSNPPVPSSPQPPNYDHPSVLYPANTVVSIKLTPCSGICEQRP